MFALWVKVSAASGFAVNNARGQPLLVSAWRRYVIVWLCAVVAAISSTTTLMMMQLDRRFIGTPRICDAHVASVHVDPLVLRPLGQIRSKHHSTAGWQKVATDTSPSGGGTTYAARAPQTRGSRTEVSEHTRPGD